jgi:acyl carrier protein
MARFRDLIQRARAWRLRSSELGDPTITVTSLGKQGVEGVLPLVFPPQVAIVGFGKVVERPWAEEGGCSSGRSYTRASPPTIASSTGCCRLPKRWRRVAREARGKEAANAMTENEIRQTVPHALGEIAPELDPAQLRPDVDLRDQLDIDSMDFLNFAVALNEELGVEIPEADYGKVQTVDRLVEYVGVRI